MTVQATRGVRWRPVREPAHRRAAGAAPSVVGRHQPPWGEARAALNELAPDSRRDRAVGRAAVV